LTPPAHLPAAFTRTLEMGMGDPQRGDIFAGRFEIIERLGSGGMGLVFRAFDKKIKEEVALKFIRPEIAAEERTVARFRNEIKIARKISHKNVCRIHDLHEEDRTLFITMEYVPGEDLKSLIRRVGQLTIGKAVFIAKQICEGLAEAHRLGVIHRDLKPQNIMIDEKGHVRIMDFGIASSLTTKGITDPGFMVGTPEYMSPEQVAGEPADFRADIYSLGVILFEMVTGRVPFMGDTSLSIAMKHKFERPCPPRKMNAHIPLELNDVILTCLEKNRDNRYADGNILREKLETLERAIPTTSDIGAPAGLSRRLPEAARSLRRRPGRIPLMIGVGALALLAVNVGWKLIRPAKIYENHIQLEITSADQDEMHKKLVEYAFLRALSAAGRWNVFLQKDLLTFKFNPPMAAITGEIRPRIAGFDIRVTMRFRDRIEKRTFDCKGAFDFMTRRMGDILAFLAEQSDGIIGSIDGGKSIAQISTSNLDALNHFIQGEEAWNRLESETAWHEFRTALENDSAFSLAHLRLGDVQIFRSDREGARRHLEQALEGRDRLIELDMLRLRALLARLDSNPAEERQYVGMLTEGFPFKKEYRYEFGESYFHYGEAEEAIKHYRKALELDDVYALAHNHIAYCYSWLGEHEIALEHLMRYRTLDNTANSCDSLATGYMFAGDYESALEALDQGIRLDPNLDYLYGNMAHQYILTGRLDKAREAVLRQKDVTTRDSTRMNVIFWTAFIEYLKGGGGSAVEMLAPLREYYLQPRFKNRLDESPNLAFWLTGVIAAERGDLDALRREIEHFEQKVSSNGVTATNFFPIFKFYIHLKALEGRLSGDSRAVATHIEEGKRIRNKMGYWGSFFNMPFFYNRYAEILLDMDRSEEASILLEAARKYNPGFPWTPLNLAKIHLLGDEKEQAAGEVARGEELMREADPEFVLAVELADLKRRL